MLYEDVYRGVDVRYYGTQRKLEYDFIVAAGADASQIRLRFEGAEARLDAKGNLLLRTSEGRDLTFDAPVSYREGPNGREAVASSYRLHADGSVSIRLGAYDKSRELVIDPVLSSASYFGEAGTETGVDVAVDAAGKVYVTGSTNSTGGVLGTVLGGLFGTTTVDTYVAKFNADLSALEWTARVGGDGEDRPTAIAVDAAGSAVVTGWTRSTDFATSGAADTSRSGTQDAFVYRLDAAGTGVAFATYFGDANNGETGNGIALDASGNIYVTGIASGASGGGTDAFVARYGPGGALQLQFKYGGGNDDTGNDIAVDGAGDMYVVGNTKGGSPAMLGGHQTGRAGGAEGFLARFTASGTLVYGTFIGGDEDDTAVAVAVDGNGRAYVVGQTEKSDDSGFQLTTGAWNTHRIGGFTGYLRIYDTDLTGAASLVYSTLVGGNGPNDDPIGVALRGDVVVVLTNAASPGFAVTTDALKATHSPGTLHVAAINPGGAGAGDLVWGSYYGNGVTGGGLAVSGLSIYVAGSTGANGLATTGAADTTRSGQDAIVGRLTLLNDPPVLTGFNGPTMLEDLPGNGFSVLSLITGKLTDTNVGAVLGVAITGSTSVGGTGTTRSTAAPTGSRSVRPPRAPPCC
ncbi:hypothetical protein HK414_16505 [Ramlibacter terrae]|uniref:DUF7948 domain-containing protein n=1 Tax=Ramlibacter terrae TaxID=2732511 RepID=A0ABX6P5E0_9BURK|nr:hypothetical protein HK414_16505 [Ramlibacter terrae]